MKILITTACILFVNAAFSKTICVAHRGNNIDEYENSFRSFLSAAKMGAAVEFDIRHTKDQVAIVLHDSKPKRTIVARSGDCHLKRKISKQNSENLLKNCQLLDQSDIPTLDKTLKLLSSYKIKVFIEFKDSPVINDLKIIEKYYKNRSDRIFFISFKEKYLKKLKNWLSLFEGLNKVKILKLGMLFKKNYHRFDGQDITKLSKSSQAKILHYQNSGKIVSVWTKDSVKSIEKFIKLNVDYITTNNPRLCLKLLE